MEDLTESFSQGFQVTVEPNSVSCPHPRFGFYKMKSEISNQEKRRQEILKLQKEKRFDVMKHVRSLTDDIWEDTEELEEDELAQNETMEIEIHLRQPGRHYKNQLMLSEWMLEVPENFAVDWLMVPCPVGKRNLVVASRGLTKAYARNGRLVNTFQSVLPGGSHRMQQWKSDITILDCVYDELSSTYFVLDMMCWRKTPIFDSESEFRFYWLKTKFTEDVEADSSKKLCKYNFVPLENFPCSPESITDIMNQPFTFELDGILFYHKRAHYTFGTTPLVVWLKTYMLPEILGIAVPNFYLTMAPSSYGSFSQHAETVRQKRLKRETGSKQRQMKDSNVEHAAVAMDSCIGEGDDLENNSTIIVDSSSCANDIPGLSVHLEPE